MKHLKSTSLLYGCLLVLATGCGQGSDSSDSGDIPVIDFSAEYPREAINIQDIADVEYIPLEINDSCLLSNAYITMTDDCIFTFNGKYDIIVFHRDGSYSHSFNHVGEAPTEYQSISRLIIDPDNLCIFVTDSSSDIIQQYNFSGNHLKRIKLPDKYRHGQELFIYDKNTLLGIDRKNTSNEELRQQHGVNHKPFYYIDLTTDSITELPIEMVDPTSDGVTWFVDNSVYGICLWTPQFSTIGDQIIVSDAMEDNISVFTDGRLKPIIAKRNKVSEGGYPYLTTIDGMNERYILLHTIEKAIDLESNSVLDPRQLLYDRHTGDWTHITLSNQDIDKNGPLNYYESRPSGSIHALPEGYIAQVILAEDLCYLLDEGKLSGPLEELAKTISPEDNPIIMLARLKN